MLPPPLWLPLLFFLLFFFAGTDTDPPLVVPESFNVCNNSLYLLSWILLFIRFCVVALIAPLGLSTIPLKRLPASSPPNGSRTWSKLSPATSSPSSNIPTPRLPLPLIWLISSSFSSPLLLSFLFPLSFLSLSASNCLLPLALIWLMSSVSFYRYPLFLD